MGPSWGRAGSKRIAGELQETAYCEQTLLSISCNVTSAILATSLTAFVFFFMHSMNGPDAERL